MSDIYSALPIRTEGDTTEKVQVRVLDATTDANKLAVNAEGRAKALLDGDYDAVSNVDPSSSGLVAHDRVANPAKADQNKRLTGITSGSVHALDISLHDESGNAYGPSNPLQVEVTPMPVSFIHNKATAVAKDASNTHTLTAAGDIFIHRIDITASGKMKVEIENNNVVVAVGFNSTANPNIVFEFNPPIQVNDTEDLEIIRTNLESTQDLYSTIYYKTV